MPAILMIRPSAMIIPVHKVVQKKTSSKENYKTYEQGGKNPQVWTKNTLIEANGITTDFFFERKN